MGNELSCEFCSVSSNLGFANMGIGLQPDMEKVKKFQEAAAKGDSESLRAMIEKHGKFLDLNAKDEEGNTALHKAADGGHLRAVKILIKYGANSQVVNNQQVNPWMMALANKHKEVAHILQQEKAFERRASVEVNPIRAKDNFRRNARLSASGEIFGARDSMKSLSLSPERVQSSPEPFTKSPSADYEQDLSRNITPKGGDAVQFRKVPNALRTTSTPA